jgi:PIN domain nuclease of toxin-antitoxin system
VTGLLLDTHAVMWWLTDDATLPDDVKARLDDDPDVWISSATVWEVAIKRSIGKIVEPDNLADEIARSGFRQLPVTVEHTISAGCLPLVHRDPFDRMLVAQARCEGLTLVTRDPQIRRYEVALLPV